MAKKKGQCYLGAVGTCWVQILTPTNPPNPVHVPPTFPAYGRAGPDVTSVGGVCLNNQGIPFAGRVVISPPNWEIMFYNLPPGDYRLYVNGSGPNCNCGDGPKILQIP